MPGHISSVNLGSRAPSTTHSGAPTGIDKRAVARIEVAAPGPRKGRSGVTGDFIGSAQHHGGDEQAVYAVAQEELDFWGAELGRELAPGCFGENLTTTGFDVDAALIDEVWRVGSATLVVTGPRIPCATFAAHMGAPRWVKRFSARGRTGAYLAVLEAGSIAPGDELVVLERPEHGIAVPVAFAACMGDPAARQAFAAADAGRPALRSYILD